MPDMRKLGDMVKLSDAINFLWRVNRNIFNQGAYRQRPNLMKAYFNPPYNEDLSDSFGFPLGGPERGRNPIVQTTSSMDGFLPQPLPGTRKKRKADDGTGETACGRKIRQAETTHNHTATTQWTPREAGPTDT